MFLTTLTSSLLFLNALPIPCSLKKNLYKITAVTQRSVHFTLAAKDRVRVLTWLLSYVQSKNTFYSLGPGACFSKVPSIYGSGVIILDFIQRNNNASLGYHQPILFLLAIHLLFQLQNVHFYILNETQLGKIYFYRPFKLSGIWRTGLQVTMSQQILASGQEMLGYNSVMD